jgi:hypothetical protein
LFLSGIDGRKFFAYDLAKIYRIQDRWHAVFRMYANDALNYHDMLLRVDSNKVWIEDVYIMAVGRQLSDIMHESYVAGIPSAQSNQRNRDNLLLMRSKFLLDNERYNESLATFDSISSDYKKQKALRLYRLQIGANIPIKPTSANWSVLKKTFPMTPAPCSCKSTRISCTAIIRMYSKALKSLRRFMAGIRLLIICTPTH